MKKWIAICLFLLALFLVYAEQYYQAEPVALDALESDDFVSVSPTKYGWMFDGPGESDALIFYPGGKVEEIAYAPLLHRIAEQGMDACLVKMPLRLAIFGGKKADEVVASHKYERWYIGGHSLGGAMAANYAAKNPEKLVGAILLAAYSTNPLDDSLSVLTIYGSEDGVLNMKKMADGKRFLPENSEEYIIKGGNHAQFGNYGKQRGDGEATISAEEQQRQTVELIFHEE